MVMSSSYYTRKEGTTLLRVDQEIYRSDSIESVQFSISNNNGKTWEQTDKVQTTVPEGTGTRQLAFRSGVNDPNTDRFIHIYNAAYWPNDDPLDGMRRWLPHYKVSMDGGQSWIVDEPIIQQGSEFDESHPMTGVWEGKNCCMQGDLTCVPFPMPSGEMLVPVQISPVGEDGFYHKPSKSFTFTDTAVLIGKWNSAEKIDWELSDRITGDANVSTRGVIEPTLGLLSDDRPLMVMRGSNDGQFDLPSRRWFSISTDGGMTWPEARPWTFSNGNSFFSPSSCSQLLHHSSGKLFWLGNINPENSKGNRPRYPFVIGEVDPDSGLMIEETVNQIDTKQADDSDLLTLSNFFAREDRETNEIVLHMSRAFADSVGEDYNWTANADLYRITVS
jgi:hypothetical protein